MHLTSVRYGKLDRQNKQQAVEKSLPKDHRHFCPDLRRTFTCGLVMKNLDPIKWFPGTKRPLEEILNCELPPVNVATYYGGTSNGGKLIIKCI